MRVGLDDVIWGELWLSLEKEEAYYLHLAIQVLQVDWSTSV
jgi:hypothetical protein